MLNAAPSATTGPWRASCAWMSQFAVFIACQIPVRFGLPSAVRGNGLDCACPVGAISPTSVAIVTVNATSTLAPINRARIGNPPLCGGKYRRERKRRVESGRAPVTRQASNLLVESCFWVAIQLLRYEVLDLSCGYRRERRHNDGASSSTECLESPADHRSARRRSTGVRAVVRGARRRFARTSRSEARPVVRVAGHADGGHRVQAARD